MSFGSCQQKGRDQRSGCNVKHSLVCAKAGSYGWAVVGVKFSLDAVQNDLQAMSRAHRIGQTEMVNIYRYKPSSKTSRELVSSNLAADSQVSV